MCVYVSVHMHGVFCLCVKKCVHAYVYVCGFCFEGRKNRTKLIRILLSAKDHTCTTYMYIGTRTNTRTQTASAHTHTMGGEEGKTMRERKKNFSHSTRII